MFYILGSRSARDSTLSSQKRPAVWHPDVQHNKSRIIRVELKRRRHPKALDVGHDLNLEKNVLMFGMLRIAREGDLRSEVHSPVGGPRHVTVQLRVPLENRRLKRL